MKTGLSLGALAGALTVLAACAAGPTGPVDAEPPDQPGVPTQTGSTNTLDETPPVLSVLAVNLDSLRFFFPFGIEMEIGGYQAPWKLITLDTLNSVYAVSAGIVTAIRSQPSYNDVEFDVKPSANSAFTVIYDHVTDVTIKVGDRVTPGQRLGRVARWANIGEGRWLGQFELQVNRAVTENGRPVQPYRELAYCPRDFGTPEFNERHAAALARTGHPSLPTPSLCLKDHVVP